MCVIEARVRGWRRSQAQLSPSCKLLLLQLLEMANFLNHVLRSGIAAIEEALRASQAPVPEISSLEWLLQQTPSTTGRTRAEIDAELSEARNW